MGKDFKYNFVALWTCVIACCAWSYALDLRYYRFTYTSWDLPLYANLMWNLCHGHLSTSLFGGNFLIDHFNVIAFVLVPFYYFFQSALTMLYFKLIAFFIGAYIFYLLTAKRLGGPWGLAFMLAYIFYPANVTMIFFEFNFENLALPMIFLIFYFFEEKKYLSFMVTCFLLTMTKENMPLIVSMFGIYGLMMRKEDRLRWGLYPLLLGLAMFVGEVFVLIPWFRQGLGSGNIHLSVYSKLGASPWGIVRTFIFKEPEVFKLLFSSRNLEFLSQLFGPMVGTALLAPQVLFIAVPLFLQNLLSKFPGQQDINYFYASTMAVFIFMATIDFLGRIKVKIKEYFIFFLIGLLFLFDLSYFHRWCQRIEPFEEKQAVSQYFLSQIPPDAKVICSYQFLYMLAQRKDLYVLFVKEGKFSHQKVTVPDTVDYMAVDFQNRLDNRDIAERALLQGQWTVQAAADDVVLLRKNGVRGKMLIEKGKAVLSGAKPLPRPMTVGDALKMEGLDVPISLKFGQRIMRIVFYWEALKDNLNYSLPKIYLNIIQGNRTFFIKGKDPFYMLPVKKGEHYKEVYYYLIPQLSPGQYLVIISSMPSTKKNSRQTLRSNICVNNISVLSN